MGLTYSGEVCPKCGAGTSAARREFHFLVATLDDDLLTIEGIDRNGEAMHTFVVGDVGD